MEAPSRRGISTRQSITDFVTVVLVAQLNRRGINKCRKAENVQFLSEAGGERLFLLYFG